MKRWVHASIDSIVTMYHGGKLHGFYDKQADLMIMPDLGLHVGSLEQAESHSKDGTVLAVTFKLRNIVEVEDQNDWYTPVAAANILKAGGVNISSAAVVDMMREAGVASKNTKSKSKFLCKLLTENGISVIQYTNTEDLVNDTCYCIVDPSVIESVQVVSASRLESSFKIDFVRTLPAEIQDNLFYAHKLNGSIVDSFYQIAFKPIDSDPDKSTIYIESHYIGEMRKCLKQYIEDGALEESNEISITRPAPNFTFTDN